MYSIAYLWKLNYKNKHIVAMGILLSKESASILIYTLSQYIAETYDC